LFNSYKIISPPDIRSKSAQGVQIQNTMQIQKLLDSITKNVKEGSLYFGSVNDQNHEYVNISSKPLSSNAIDILKAALKEQPDTLVRLHFKSMAMGNVIFLNEADAQRILEANAETIKSFGIPQNRLTDDMVQQDQANTREVKPLDEKTYIQIGPVSMVVINKPTIWSEGPRTYLKVTATTTDVHIFRDGYVEHIVLLDEESGMVHFTTIGGGDSPAGFFAHSNVDSAASLWPNRDEVERLIYESGKSLNTFDTPETIAQIVENTDRTFRFERWALQKLDGISPYIFPLKDNWLNNPLTRLTNTDSQIATTEEIAAILAAILAAIAVAYANGEDYWPEDDAATLKTEVDGIVREEQNQPPSDAASQETKPPSNTDDNKPDDSDPFKANQNADDQAAIGQEVSDLKTPTNDERAKLADNILKDPPPNQKPDESILEKPIERPVERLPEEPVK
jgi:hypothetical protein